MKWHFIFLVILGYLPKTYSQGKQPSNGKPVIDSSAVKLWVDLGAAGISDDGNYVYFTAFNEPIGTYKLTISSVKSNWKREFIHTSRVSFSPDSKRVIFKQGTDSLCLLSLGEDKISYISNVGDYKISSGDANRKGWLVYTSNSATKELVLRGLDGSAELRIPFVSNYFFNDSSNCLLVDAGVGQDSSVYNSLKWITLPGKIIKEIWSGTQQKVSCLTFNDSGDRLAFIVEKVIGDQATNELWYYRDGMNGAMLLADNHASGIGDGLEISTQKPQFSKDGKRVFFGLQSIRTKPRKQSGVLLDVWSYTDPVLQSEQMEELKYGRNYTSVIGIDERRVRQLEFDNERTMAIRGNWLWVMHKLGNSGIFEENWNSNAQYACYLVSAVDGSRRILRKPIPKYSEMDVISPTGKWFIYYDFISKNYFSYEVGTGKIHNITHAIKTTWTMDKIEIPEPYLAWVDRETGWFKDDEAMLINDEYDIWQVDPGGVKAPISITNGFGRSHHIRFNLVDEGASLKNFSRPQSHFLLLKAFNDINKDAGFYRKDLNDKGDPEPLYMGAYVYGWWNGHGSYNYPPVKANFADVYLVLRMSATEAPNYMVTKDFRSYKAISSVEPQKNFNWLTTTLIHWKGLDGGSLAGVLYKPENFDPKKRYPIIFDYYEERSDELNFFRRPNPALGRINIPWFVSHGYLVFTPDIHYKIGNPGTSAFNSVISAARYFSKKPWVDKEHMGIQGHSFGGYETEYIVTHTDIFAAACAASGISDLIGFYGSAVRAGYPMFWAERDQGRMGGTPWQIRDLYITNSPIFNADKVTTPLLLMQNKGDEIIPFAQGLEFFTALRRLRKRVWMLQYDDGSHTVSGRSSEDYSIRLGQFFDHYLKGKASPKWMTRGIPAKDKGIDNGFELDESVKTPLH